jgi:hypothetical protein
MHADEPARRDFLLGLTAGLLAWLGVCSTRSRRDPVPDPSVVGGVPRRPAAAVVETVDPLDCISTHTYDASGRLVGVQNSLPVQTYSYDPERGLA